MNEDFTQRPGVPDALAGRRARPRVASHSQYGSHLKAETDVTALREREWHAARVTQASLLVASLAHELFQPLTAILNNADAGLRFLDSDNLPAGEMRDILVDIVASTRKASEVLGTLRAMLTRRPTTRVTFDAAEGVQEVLALVRRELMSEEIHVDTAFAEGCWVNADKTHIGQVLLNLIMNSIDAMRGKRDAARRLQLAVSRDGTDVHVLVKDTGRGISTDEFGKVFEPFWTTKEEGLGMGLPLCRSIVESYGGCIWCERNGAGEVTFRFSLPSAKTADDNNAPKTPVG